MQIDKNDVDISKLFLWNTDVDILDSKGNIIGTVYMRLVGDADLNRARVIALKESSKLRKLLRNPNTDEHMAFISELQDRTKDFVAKAVILLTMQDISRRARDNVILKLPQEPSSDASLEEQEIYQRKIDEFPNKYTELVEKEMVRLAKLDENRLLKMDEEKLREYYKETLIESLCRMKMGEIFTDMCIYLGTHKDKERKVLTFSSFDEYYNSSQELKDQLKVAYNKLELDMDNLKK